MSTPPTSEDSPSSVPSPTGPHRTGADSSGRRLRPANLPVMSRRGLLAALRETAIVVFGVLIALWVNNWNERRTETRLERQYLQRIVEDLTADTAMFGQMLAITQEKAESLGLLGPLLRSNDQIPDTLGFLRAIIRSASLSWAHPPVRRTTFSELENTGDLRLISDPGLRSRITEYYFFAGDEANRIDQRRTGYGALSYRLLPHMSYGMLGGKPEQEAGGVSDVAYLEALTEDDRRRLVQTARDSELSDLVQAEENFTRFAARSQAEVQRRAVALLSDLEARL
jgi:hypothetical protein